MSEKFGYGFGAVASGTHFVVTGVEWELEEKDVQHAIVFEFAKGSWTAWSIDFRVASTAIASGLYFAVGADGRVEVTAADSAWDERVDSTGEGPSSIRPINGVAVIGDFVYAAGMRRQVYRRPIAQRNWSRVDHGCRANQAVGKVVGLNAIDGRAPDDLYAVGLLGEIWRCRSGNWTQLDSPTNVRLDIVRHLSSGTVLAGGALGTLIRVTDMSAEPVVQSATRKPITGIVEFLGRVYVAVEAGQLFEFRDNGLVPVDVPFASNEGGGQLAVGEDRMMFVRNDSVVLFDGSQWSDATPPDDA